MQEPTNIDVLYATLAAALASEPPPLRIDADGVIRVGTTRVTIDTVIGAYQEGASAEEIALAYDALQLPEIHAALSFYLRHRLVVEEYLAERQQRNDGVRKENELRWPTNGIREQLLSRRRRASKVLRFLTDENLNGDIVRGLRRRSQELDMVRVQDVGLSGADDPHVLEWAAREGRILLTHDVTTMTRYVHDRIAARRPMPGVFEVKRSMPVGEAINELLLLAECSLDDEWQDQIRYLPL